MVKKNGSLMDLETSATVTVADVMVNLEADGTENEEHGYGDKVLQFSIFMGYSTSPSLTLSGVRVTKKGGMISTAQSARISSSSELTLFRNIRTHKGSSAGSQCGRTPPS